MHMEQAIVRGTLKPDGTLELAERPSLPAGPVEVLIRVQNEKATLEETWWEYLQRARGELLAQGFVFRTREEIDADRARQHDKDEARRRSLRSHEPPSE